MKYLLTLILTLILVFQSCLCQTQKIVRTWCFDKDLNQLKRADTISFITPDSLLDKTFKFFDNGAFAVCTEMKTLKLCKWDKIGTWSFKNKTLTVQTSDLLLNLKLISSTKDELLFVAKDTQSGDFSRNNTVFDKSKIHMDFKMGACYNFIDQRTNIYINNYANVSFGASFYFKNFILSYSFNPATIRHVKSSFKSIDGFEVSSYDRGNLNSRGTYWFNIIKNNIDMGYEKKLKKMWSITPSVGFVIVDLFVIDHTLNNWKNNIGQFYGGNVGITFRKYINVADNVRFFIGFSNSFNFYNVNTKFPELGNHYHMTSINIGFKFRPTGQALIYLLSGLTNLN